ncbi:symporter [Aureococcus anophagefferens]|nr:symporter [Aureococcus anophagefferens]
MEVVWSCRSDDNCTNSYGPAYRDIHSLTTLHASLAGDKSCDHMHDGLGFLTQHMGLTLSFEQALQAVDPSISMPYWDYTIDKQNLTAASGRRRYLGGTLECNETSNDLVHMLSKHVSTDDYPKFDSQRSALLYLVRTDMFLSLKNLYRDDRLTMPSYCSLDTPYSECHGTCDDATNLKKALQHNYTDFITTFWDQMFSWDVTMGRETVSSSTTGSTTTPRSSTNHEVLEMASGEPDAPYVYDTFEWNHCKDAGYG